MQQNIEGLKRLILGADITYTKFGIFKKHHLSLSLFRKWEKVNTTLYRIYWKLCNPKHQRKRVLFGRYI